MFADLGKLGGKQLRSSQIIKDVSNSAGEFTGSMNWVN